MGMNHVYVGLGSNLGDRFLNLKSAIDLMAERGIAVKETSSFYETIPVGGPEQPDFLNAVCVVDTELSAAELLLVLKQIEQEIGRTPDDPSGEKWGPRIIDLDILLFGNEMLAGDELTVPHPELTKRNFAMIPLLEIAPDLELPSGEPLSVYCDPKDPGVRKIGERE